MEVYEQRGYGSLSESGGGVKNRRARGYKVAVGTQPPVNSQAWCEA